MKVSLVKIYQNRTQDRLNEDIAEVENREKLLELSVMRPRIFFEYQMVSGF